MRFGLIGAGGMGRHQAATLANIPDATCIALTDIIVSPQTINFAEQSGAELLPSAEALLARRDIDAVIIATPTTSHAALGIAALRAGKHVFVEKPIARTLHEAEQLLEEAARSGTKLAVGHVVRYFPEYASARDLIAAGEIGNPGIARASRMTSHPAAAWYANYELSGGVILDVMIHDFDWMRWALGPIVRVSARGLMLAGHEHRDAAMAVLRFASGAIGYVEGSWCSPRFRTALEVSGSGGLLRTDNSSVVTASFATHEAERVPATWADGLEVSPYVAQMRAIHEWFCGGAAPRHTAEDGMQALRIALAAAESVRSGEAVVMEE